MSGTAATAAIEFQERPCPICGLHGRQQVVREANFDASRITGASFSSRKLPEYMHCRLLRCEDCGLLYSSPAPAPALLASLYRDATFTASKESAFAARTYVDCLRKVGRLQPVPTLDIGAGDGAFLLELHRHGFAELGGFEPSEAPLTAADPEIRSCIRAELFDASLVADASLGLITCFQTIEHVYEPLRLARDMYRVLAPGGAAFLIAHDVAAFSARVMGYRSPIYDVEHLQLFDARSARALMETAGFTATRIFPITNAYPVAYWTRLFPLPDGVKARLLPMLEKGGPLSWLGGSVVRLPAGNLAIVGTK